MATLAELHDALINADRAGDKESARMLADAIVSMRSASQPTGEKMSVSSSGFVRGAMDPIEGAAQLLTHVLPDSVVSAGNRLNNYLADTEANKFLQQYGIGLDKYPEGGIDEQLKQQEAQYQQARADRGESGIDWARIAGNVASPANLAAGAVLRPAQGAGLAGKMLSGGAMGLAQAGAAPVTSGDYWTEKGKQAAIGAATGAAVPAVMAGVGAAAKKAIGGLTGTSGETISEAVKAGREKSQTFLANMRNKTTFDEAVDQAREGLRNMRADRSALYKSGMVDISNDKTVLSLEPVEKAISAVKSMGAYKDVITDKNTANVVAEMRDRVAEWATLPKAEYHTPEGFDALKRAIGGIRDTTQPGTAARAAADSVYNAVKDTIKTQAPTYEKVMREYATASNVLKEVERTFSLGEKAAKDTAIRKLQSILRNNAATNYGNRDALLRVLEEKGGVNIKPMIAGQALSAIAPRGMVGAIEKAGAAPAVFLQPQLAAMLPFMSPRIMGEASYLAGRLQGPLGGLPPYLASNLALGAFGGSTTGK